MEVVGAFVKFTLVALCLPLSVGIVLSLPSVDGSVVGELSSLASTEDWGDNVAVVDEVGS